MNTIVDSFEKIKLKIASLKPAKPVNIIAVSKTFTLDYIKPLVNHGHLNFGENKVQEAIEKWTPIKEKFKNIKLHMVGKLQTNKAKFILPLFDYLHSLDNLKLAKKISEEENKHKKKIKVFIQINIGNEDQKTGIDVDDLDEFYSICINKFNLDIIGLMCLPPNKEDVKPYFLEIQKLNQKLGLQELSLGMSNDFLSAVECGSTFLRIGSQIFGQRS